MTLVDGSDVGRVKTMYGAVSEYNEHIQSTVDGKFQGLLVAIDCANGSASATAESLFYKFERNMYTSTTSRTALI